MTQAIVKVSRTVITHHVRSSQKMFRAPTRAVISAVATVMRATGLARAIAQMEETMPVSPTALAEGTMPARAIAQTEETMPVLPTAVVEETMPAWATALAEGMLQASAIALAERILRVSAIVRQRPTGPLLEPAAATMPSRVWAVVVVHSRTSIGGDPARKLRASTDRAAVACGRAVAVDAAGAKETRA
jgi:hypothetical protein